MQSTDFTDNAPGRLVPTIAGAQAFVPAPLPSVFEIGSPTIRLLAAAENALGELTGTTAREFNPYLVSSPLLHREAILSSRIEGTVTTPEQLVLLQAGSKTEHPAGRLEDTQEVLNYINAMRRGLHLLKEIPVCKRLMREIHEVLLAGVRGGQERPGRFRTEQNWLRASTSHDIADARFVPPPSEQVEPALDELERYLNVKESNDSAPFLLVLAASHYQFETIHPFRDGNGRVGRLLIPLLLCHSRRLESPILYLSAYFERNQTQYADLLLRVSQTGDWTSWFNFFLQGVRETAQEAVQQASGLLELRTEYHRRMQKGRSSALLIKLIDRLFQVPSITILDASNLLGVTSQAAANNVYKLERAGILRETTGGTRNKIFVADGIMRFMFDVPTADAE